MTSTGLPSVPLGSAVQLSGNRRGLVVYYGLIDFADGYWYGVQFTDLTIGRHNGTVNGREYFSCPPNKGIFVKPGHIQQVLHTPLPSRSRRRPHSKSKFSIPQSTPQPPHTQSTPQPHTCTQSTPQPNTHPHPDSGGRNINTNIDIDENEDIDNNFSDHINDDIDDGNHGINNIIGNNNNNNNDNYNLNHLNRPTSPTPPQFPSPSDSLPPLPPKSDPPPRYGYKRWIHKPQPSAPVLPLRALVHTRSRLSTAPTSGPKQFAQRSEDEVLKPTESPLRQEILSNNDSLEISSDSANFHYMMRRNTNLKHSMDINQGQFDHDQHQLHHQISDDHEEAEYSQTVSLMDSFRKQTLRKQTDLSRLRMHSGHFTNHYHHNHANNGLNHLNANNINNHGDGDGLNGDGKGTEIEMHRTRGINLYGHRTGGLPEDDTMEIDIRGIHISITASTEAPVQLAAKSDRTGCTADVLNGYLKEFKENDKDRESTMGRAVDKLIDGPTLIYIFVRFSVIPGFVYGAICAAIVGTDALFRSYAMSAYWTHSVDAGSLELLFGRQPWLLLFDLLLTTVLEAISIWIIIAKMVRSDLKKEVVSGLNEHFNVKDCSLCKRCIFEMMRNGIIPKSSCCVQCVRTCYSTFMFTLLAVMVFFVPMALVICILITQKRVAVADYLDMCVFKAGYGGIMAFTLSPITAFLTLVSQTMNHPPIAVKKK